MGKTPAKKRKHGDSLWSVEQPNPDVVLVRHPYVSAPAQWEQNYFLMSDTHIDGHGCDEDKLIEHLELAKSMKAGIFIRGDIFDVVNSAHDKRRSLWTLRPELKGDNYLNLCVDRVAEFLRPYAENIIAISYGNHETSVIKHNNVDLLTLLVARFPHIRIQNYSGYVRFMVKPAWGGDQSRDLWFHHGKGGGDRSKGVLVNDIIQGEADADIYHLGHTHHNYLTFGARERLNLAGEIVENRVVFVRTPGYQKQDRRKGFATEKGYGNRVTGCAVMKLFFEHSRREGGNTRWPLRHEVTMLT